MKNQMLDWFCPHKIGKKNLKLMNLMNKSLNPLLAHHTGLLPFPSFIYSMRHWK